ncbi:MAG TPA: hypothetical protein VNZ43_02655 [Sphingomonadaceae bacterium]|nr:hypothetical protein [Sphingomonadaceae bacterium]
MDSSHPDHPADGREPLAIDDVAPRDAQLPPSLYNRAIDLRYWGAALVGGGLIWAALFKLL